ncbi:hypothetical protein C8Q76DRAFT_771335 [Earliella scabrosa]|nr:hypothetical protein C8Q76DRAFT_771335 [Earliella scabrosa]
MCSRGRNLTPVCIFLVVVPVTPPNQHWVPVWPREPQVLRTYTDGTWGLHEYSRWPQTVIPNMWHVADDDLPDVLWISLCPSRDWIEDRFCGLIGHGFLVESIRSDLHRAAEDIIARARAITGVSPRRMAFVRELILVLQQCVERMRRLPSLPVMAVAVGAHIQRLSLELLGLERYLLIVLPRLESGRDYSSAVLPTLGGFVVDRTTAARSVRCGLPTWLVQPFRPDIRVWRVVECTYPPHVPPSHLATVGPQPLAEITNVAGNWLGSMVFAISRQLCDLQLPSLAPEIGAVHALKRHRLEPSRPLANSRAVKHTPALSPRPGPGPSTEARTRSANSHDGPRHPSRQYVPSPFYTPPTPWLQALRGVKTLGPPPQSVVYFYPPPFLLDSVCAAAPLPQTLRGFVGAREDDKIPRYLHNLVRIREYCRLRVLDPRLAGRALTIAEWRAALWGDYDQKPEPVVRGTEGEQRRAKRKHQEKSDIGRLFGDGAAVESYSLADAPLLNGVPISAEQAARDPTAHEINWRCELMAIDSAMRWAREALVSAAWGTPSAMTSVLHSFAWFVPPEPRWTGCIERCRALVSLVATWPGCPTYLRRMCQEPLWSAEDYDMIIAELTLFYTNSFVTLFHRLPIVPVAFQS